MALKFEATTFVLPPGLPKEPLLLMENMENADKVWQYDYK